MTRPSRPRRGRVWWIAGLAIAALVVVVAAAFASTDPDGLERVSGDLGFLESARDSLFTILPDYTVPGIDDPVVSTVVAGLVGVVIVFLLMVGLGRVLRRRRES
jgi:hypothetical protein